jgi:hypothetical protein
MALGVVVSGVTGATSGLASARPLEAWVSSSR